MNDIKLKPWVKFKHWLIKKLGGHVYPNVVEYRYVERMPITLSADRRVRFNSAEWDRERIERRIKEELAIEIARKLLKQNLLEIEKMEDPMDWLTLYRAKLMVYAKKGEDNEQGKAD